MAKAKPAAAASTSAAPVYALVGEDSFLQLQKLSEILALMPPDVQRSDADGERAELADVLDELRSFAMFGGGGKLVVLRNADAFLTRFREQLEDYVASPSDSATLVLRLASLPKAQRIYKAIAKVGRVEDCEPPAALNDLARWAGDHARAAHGVKLAPDAARLLAELVGSDLGRLDGEIAKLALQRDEKSADRPITPDEVSASVAFQREQELKEMTGELAVGNHTEALRRWRQLSQLDASAEFRAVTWLGMWLEDVGVALSGDRAAVGKFSWKYRDRFNEFLRAAERMGRAGHARALDLLAKIDHQSKSGVGDAAANVERFILQLATGGSSPK